jgi:hypothetical protein
VGLNAIPSARPAPGGPFTFEVSITNTSNENLVVASLDDSVYGDLDNFGSCTTQQTIIPGTTYHCTYSGTLNGPNGTSETHTVDAVAIDSDGNNARDAEAETISLTAPLPPPPPPTTTTTVLPAPPVHRVNHRPELFLGVTNTAVPTSQPEPGGTVSFTVVVANFSVVPVTITRISDDVYGNVGANGDCQRLIGARLAAGANASCVFSGIFTGTNGRAQRNVVVVTAQDDFGRTVEGADDAELTMTAPQPPVTTTSTTSAAPSIPVTGSGTARTAAAAVAVASFGLLFFGLADERRRAVMNRLRG